MDDRVRIVQTEDGIRIEASGHRESLIEVLGEAEEEIFKFMESED